MKAANISVFFSQIFGAYATHPFKFSDHYYGTGETFLYTFSPNFKVPGWERYQISPVAGSGLWVGLEVGSYCWSSSYPDSLRPGRPPMAAAQRPLRVSAGSLHRPRRGLPYCVFWDPGRDCESVTWAPEILLTS